MWDVTVFTKNGERLIAGDIASKFMAAVLNQERGQDAAAAIRRGAAASCRQAEERNPVKVAGPGSELEGPEPLNDRATLRRRARR